MSKINKINVQGTDYDVDVPVGTGTAGQVLTINSTGDGTEWTTVGGGSQKYMHNIKLYGSGTYSNIRANLTIISDRSTSYTKGDLIALLYTSYDRKVIEASGSFLDNGKICVIYGINANSSTNANLFYSVYTLDISTGQFTVNADGAISSNNFSIEYDTVVAL